MRITSIATDHVAGHGVDIQGTAAANKVISVAGHDPKNGTRVLGETNSDSNGGWNLSLPGGVLYNTVVQATSGTQKSNFAPINVHQVLKVTGERFLGERSNGFRYKMTGSTRSHIPGERMTITLNGRTLGSATLRSNGTFAITFTVKHRHQRVAVHGSGRSSSGTRYTLAGTGHFRT